LAEWARNRVPFTFAEKDAAMSEPTSPRDVEAEYTLESLVVCPHCKEHIDTVEVVRLIRTRINFTSSLPRRGQVMTCTSCHAVLAGGLGGLL